jgi:5-methylcytosine-specific restriction endonuclease McrA
MYSVGEEQYLRHARANRERQIAKHAKRKAKKAAAKARRQAELKAIPSKPKRARNPKQKAGSVYKTQAWKRLRYEVLCEQKSTCQICGASPRDGSVMQVDHFYPISSHPQLALEKSNLRVLCASCNWGKGGRNPNVNGGGKVQREAGAERRPKWATPLV